MEVTLLTENTRVRYTGDGVLKEFSYPFNPIDLSYVKVYKNLQPVTAPDVTISSGVVTFNTAPAEGDSIVIIREKPLTYDSGIVSKGIISPDSLDNLAVELLGQIQQVNEKLDRVPVYPIDTTMTGEEILNQFNQDVQTVKDSRVEVEGKAEEINSTVSSGLTEISNATSESKSQITEEKNTSISEIQRVTEGLIDRAEVAADESESWANKAESFANQANLDSIRTNCLTAIPQDIKLELNNGTLTLKAGSKVTFGDGTSITIDVDKNASFTITSVDKYALFYTKYSNSLTFNRLGSQTASGTTTPTSGYWAYYNTTDKKVYDINDGVNAGELSLPLCIFSSDTSSITSIDQVFNGFGYIGSTIFALPGVEGLIPNGFNTDGSLNSIEFTTSNVLTVTLPDARNFYIMLNAQNISVPSINSIVYDPFTNKNLFNGSRSLFVNSGTGSSDSTGRITSFNPKTVFQATDYYDFKQLDDSAAKLDKNNTFIGTSNTFSTNMIVKNTSQAWDNNLSGTTRFGQVVFQDNTGYSVSYIRPTVTSDGKRFLEITVADVNKNAKFYSFYPEKLTIPASPATSDNSATVATTAWVRQVAALKDLSNTGLTANRALYTNGSGVVTVSAVTSTELGYLEGVTSKVQNQLNAKANLASPAFSGTPTAPTPPTSDNSTKIATTAFVNSNLSQSIQTGVIVPFAGDNPPSGWLKCDGAQVSRTTYAKLFSVIGTKYGAGNGSSTFTLPNFINRTFWGGSSSGSYLNGNVPNIIGQFDVPNGRFVGGEDYFLPSGAFALLGNASNVGNTGGGSGEGGKLQFNASRSSGRYTSSNIVRPESLQTIICIKY